MHNLIHGYKLISKGAEAYIYLCFFGKFKAIRKIRIRKMYRIPEVDKMIRRLRTKREAKLLHLARKIGIPTPIVFDVDLRSCSIIMEFIEGELLKNAILRGDISHEEAVKIFEKIGEFTGILHENNIIHGDLTTSNIILTPNHDVVFIDFGLGEINNEDEAKGIELRVLWTSLSSVHYKNADVFLQAFLQGYTRNYSAAKRAIKIFHEIRLRGRYIAERRLRSMYIRE